MKERAPAYKVHHPIIGDRVTFTDMGWITCSGVVVEADALSVLVWMHNKSNHQMCRFVLRPDGRYQWGEVSDDEPQGILCGEEDGEAGDE